METGTEKGTSLGGRGYMVAESYFVWENILVRSEGACVALEVSVASPLLFCMVEQNRTVPEASGWGAFAVLWCDPHENQV